MREYKFRVWDNLKKEMLFEGFHIFGEVTLFNAIGTHAYETRGDKTSLDRYNDFEVTQWTGLKDKNKKEVYESDIILDLWTKEVYVVKFGICEDHAFTGWYCENDHKVTTLNPDYYDGDINSAIEIIGNIYQNPSLINTKQ